MVKRILATQMTNPGDLGQDFLLAGEYKATAPLIATPPLEPCMRKMDGASSECRGAVLLSAALQAILTPAAVGLRRLLLAFVT